MLQMYRSGCSCRLAIVIGLILLTGCAPVYIFQVPEAEPDIALLRSRLREVLAKNDLQSVGRSDAMVGAIGCGRDSPDRNTSMRMWQDSWGINRRITVHDFTCDGKWQVMVVSSTDAHQAADELRKQIEIAFGSEIESGIVRVRKRCRPAFE
jgi:hypothetical protein